MNKEDLLRGYEILQNGWAAEIRTFTKGNKIEFEPFKDEANNMIYAVDNNDVYFEDDEKYPIEELGFWDAYILLDKLERPLEIL